MLIHSQVFLVDYRLVEITKMKNISNTEIINATINNPKREGFITNNLLAKLHHLNK